MYTYVELETLSGAPAFATTCARRSFLGRAGRLGAARGLSVVAYALQPDRAGLLVEGEGSGAPRWVAHLRTGHALWRRHRGLALRWGEPAIIPLPGVEVATEFAVGLLRLGRPDPLADPGGALRDAVGLRESAAFDASWLRARGAPEWWMQAAGLGQARLPRLSATGPAPFISWWQVEAAVEAATGALASERA